VADKDAAITSLRGDSRRLAGTGSARAGPLSGATNATINRHRTPRVYATPAPRRAAFAVPGAPKLTRRAGGPRTTMSEVAVYTVQDDKIVREEFFIATIDVMDSW
jgi:hypothetical protein